MSECPSENNTSSIEEIECKTEPAGLPTDEAVAVIEESEVEPCKGPMSAGLVADEQTADEPIANESKVILDENATETCVPEAASVTAPTESVDEDSAAEIKLADPTAAAPVAIETEQPTEPAEAAVNPDVKEPAEAVTNEPTDETVIAESAEPVEKEFSFKDLPLSNDVLKAVEKAGYESPSAIQREIIPYMADGRDVLAQSQTGSGKTAAFALPILSNVELRKGPPQVLVLAPTRELAIQVSMSFEKYASSVSGFRVATIYGGQSYEPQLRQLRRGVHVVVGTPGRVIDHIKQGSLDLSQVSCLVLDEADEMLNMGFLEDVEFVLQRIPDERQIALFSATLPKPIREISKNYLTNPARVTIKAKTMTADSIRQRALFVSPREKLDVLTKILEAEETDGVIVFTKTKESTVVVAEKLGRAGFLAVALNGDMPQRSRERTIERLKAGHVNILVATDVAARGLDVTRVSHVFNYDLPHDTQSYIHRIGRTGRAGRKGEAIIFLTGGQRHKLRVIEKATRQPIDLVQPPTADSINERRIKRFSQNIDKTIANEKAARDLAMFQKLIVDHAEESGQPVELIAAALANAAQNGRPFLMKDRPRKSDDREYGDKGGDRKNKRKRERNSGPPSEGMIRYRIQVGWRDNVKPGNIVGAIANEAGIDGQYIGPIEIHHGFSTIDLPEGMPQETFRLLQRCWVAGRQMRITVDGERPDRPRRRSNESGKPRSMGNRSSGGTGGKGRKHKKPRQGDGPRSGGPGGDQSGGPKKGKFNNKNKLKKDKRKKGKNKKSMA